MQSKAEFRVIHVCPHSARLSEGHTNAIHTFMEGQLQHGLDVRGICGLGSNIPQNLRIPIEHLPIQETDFNAPDLCDVALSLAAGAPKVIYHFHGFVPRFIPLGHRLVRERIPYILTSQGQLHYRDGLHWLKKFVFLNFWVSLFRQASGLHFVSRREKERCRLLLPFYSKPTLVQPNVVRVPEPDTVVAAARAGWNLPESAVVFAFLGRLHIEHKGLDLLVQGFARLPASANAFLILIGPDWQEGKQRLETLARQLGCLDRIRFLGPHVGSAKWALLKMADVFISPSRWDACPSAVTEAIGFGLPTIVSSTMNPAAELVEGQAALAPNPTPECLAQAMQQLAADATLRRSLAHRGRCWVQERCSLPVEGSRFDKFYRQLLHL